MMNKVKSLLSRSASSILGAVAVLGLAASQAHAAEIIDYAATATSLTATLTLAIGAAIGVGVAVLGTKMGWRFFKSFTK